MSESARCSWKGAHLSKLEVEFKLSLASSWTRLEKLRGSGFGTRHPDKGFGILSADAESGFREGSTLRFCLIIMLSKSLLWLKAAMIKQLRLKIESVILSLSALSFKPLYQDILF